MKRSGKIFFYALYAAGAVCVFLYLLFPSQTVSELIMAKIAQYNDDIQVDIDDAHPTFPPGLKLQPLDISYAGMPMLEMGYVSIVPGLFSVFGKEKKVAFKGSLGDGDLKGQVTLISDGKRPQTRINADLVNVPIDVFGILQQWPDYQLAGDINSNIDYDSNQGAGGTAEIRIDIRPAKIVFGQPLLGLEQMEFSQIESHMNITPRMIQIKRCELSGNQLEGKITGSIIFRRPIQNSRITLSCTVKPQPAFLAMHKDSMIAGLLGSATAQKRGIVLRISGTLGRPNYVVR